METLPILQTVARDTTTRGPRIHVRSGRRVGEDKRELPKDIKEGKCTLTTLTHGQGLEERFRAASMDTETLPAFAKLCYLVNAVYNEYSMYIRQI